MWSDNETGVDSLNVQHVVTTIKNLLSLDYLTPLTIGVYGDWGSGKSSVVVMLRDQLAQGDTAKNTLCVAFNGWRFEGYDDAKSALMGTILEEIQANKTLPAKANEAARRLLARVNWLRVAKGVGRLSLHAGLAYVTGGASLAASGMSEALAKAKELGADQIAEKAEGLLTDPAYAKEVHQSVREFEAEFVAVLKETNLTRLVVVIDDLDRCTPDRVIETLEAIRLFLAVPKTVFILAADETMVQHAVRLRFPTMAEQRERLGQNYLEKMVQVPLRIPPLGPEELRSYMNMLFLQLHLTAEEFQKACAQLLAKNRGQGTAGFSVTAANAHEIIGRQLSDEVKRDLALAAQVGRVVELSVDGNPRQVKRFLNAFRLRLITAAARGVTLDPRVVAKMMLLEYFRPEALKTLARWQAAHDGKPSPLGRIEAVGAAPARASSSGGRKAKGGERAASPPPAAAPVDPTDLPPEASLWLADEWMQAWVGTEPLLGDVDLRPYLYFARARLGLGGHVTQRLSPAAGEVLREILSLGQVVRDRAAERAKQLSSPDVVALQEVLAERVRGSENLDEAGSPFQAMLALLKARPELLTEFITLVRSLPASRFRAGTPNRLIAVAQGMEAPAKAQLLQLVRDFSTQTDNSTLAAAARVALQPTTTG